MPSTTLYYRPLLDAAIRGVPIGKAELGDHAASAATFAFVPTPSGENRAVPQTKAAEELIPNDASAKAVAATFTGIESLLQGRAGAQALAGISISPTAEAYIANRTLKHVASHPDVLATASPDEAAQISLKLAGAAEEELNAGRGVALSAGTLDIAPEHAAVLKRVWSGVEPATAGEAAKLSREVSREIERRISPLPEDHQHQTLQWVEDATLDVLSTWRGHVGAVATKLALGADPGEVEKAAAGAREEVIAAGGGRSLAKLLGMATVDVDNPEHRAAAISLLQDVPLEAVPNALGTVIGAAAKQPDKSEWISGRIVETGGIPGNVDGLGAQLREAARASE
jgi:hypothetical protein